MQPESALIDFSNRERYGVIPAKKPKREHNLTHTLPVQVTSKPPYRAEIDGLRALAVIPVILYHAEFPGLSGGFVGVDIFFVISGYLITSILVFDFKSGQFSLRSFYERRARRILPALFMMMALSIPFAWFLLPASDMQDFSQSLVAGALFGSNFLFWSESGYFDADSSMKPLLHTWSLGVEEQFYLLFPLILMLVWRRGTKILVAVLLALALISLAIAQWSVSAAPVAGFYLLPSRFWELALGALTALLRPTQGPRAKSEVRAELASWSGFIMILFAVVSFGSSTPFPGFAALIPTVGATLIVIYARDNSSLARLLKSRPLVAVGTLSYGLYLYHFPIFAFSKRLLSGQPDFMMTTVLICLTLLVSYLSWRYVEQPFRNGAVISFEALRSIGTPVAAGLVAIGLWGHATEGFVDSKAMAANTVAEGKSTAKDFIVLGDSHGDDLQRGITHVTTGTVKNLTSNGCIPLRDVDRFDSRFEEGACAMTMNQHFDFLMSQDPEAVVVLASMGPIYLEGTGFRGSEDPRVIGLGVRLITNPALEDRWLVYGEALRSTFSELSSLENATIVFAIDWPELGIANGCNNEPKAVDFGIFELTDDISWSPSCEVDRYIHDARTLRYKNLVYSIAKDFPAIRIFDPTELFCDETICRGTNPAGHSWYRDSDHLNETGSIFVARALVERTVPK